MNSKNEEKTVRYNSAWDSFTWLILAAVALCCLFPIYLGLELVPLIICVASAVFVLATFLSVYYKIDGTDLVVYTFFRPTRYPISKIKKVVPTKSTLASPASSLSHRIAIYFTDRSVLKSRDPLVISPVRQKKFLEQLKKINPAIETE